MAKLIESERLVPAWTQAVAYLRGNGRQARNLLLEIEQPLSVPSADRIVLAKIDAQLRKYGDLSINTVAATIFPQAMYARYGRPDFYAEFANRMAKAQNRGTWGTYALRMMRRRGSKPAQTVNPLEQIIGKLARAARAGHPYKSNYELGVFEPSEDLDSDGGVVCELPIYDPASDGGKIGNIPCLSHLTFKMVDKTRVDLTAIYRSHYYCQRALGNLVGLSQLLGFVARESQLQPGTLTCISTHAVLDLASWGSITAGERLAMDLA